MPSVSNIFYVDPSFEVLVQPRSVLTTANVTYCYLAGAAKSPADHPRAPPENLPTPYRHRFLHSLSFLYRNSLPYLPSDCDCWLLGLSPSSPYSLSCCQPPPFLVGRYRHRQPPRFPPLSPIVSLSNHIYSAILFPHFIHGNSILFYTKSRQSWTQFHDLPPCLVSALRPRMRLGRWMTNGSLLGDY